jgi:azurin
MLKKWFISTGMVAAAVMSSSVFAADCSVEISGSDQMRFDKNEVSVSKECTEVTVTLKHTGQLPVNAMGHNWVVTETAQMSSVINAGMSSGLESNYLPKDNEGVLAATKLIGGGEETSVTFDVSDWNKEGDYTFFCSFPGHSALMKGKFVFN